MKLSLKALVALALVSNVVGLNFGRFLTFRRDWQGMLSAPHPQIVEVVRWRQPVCVVPGPGIPPCLLALRKHQNAYEGKSGVDETSKGETSEEGQADMKKIRSGHREIGAREELIEKYCKQKHLTENTGYGLRIPVDFIKTMETLKKMGVLREGGEDICQELTPVVLSPTIVDSIRVEGVEQVNLEGSEPSGRGLRPLALSVRSDTPGIEEGLLRRQGKYLLLGNKPSIFNKPKPAIYVTKVLNSPVTATLVANNCFPDIGVPLCDEYQETLTIYNGLPSSTGSQGFPPLQGHKKPDVSSEYSVLGHQDSQVLQHNVKPAKQEDYVEENKEEIDFWDDPNNPNFDDGSQPEQKPGILGQAVQQVLSKPGVLDTLPPAVIDAIANNPGVIETIVNHGSKPGAPFKPEGLEVAESNLDSQFESVTTTTAKPGLISSFLDIQRPILSNLWAPSFGIFNRSGEEKPEKGVQISAAAAAAAAASGDSASASASASLSIQGGLGVEDHHKKPIIEVIKDKFNKTNFIEDIKDKFNKTNFIEDIKDKFNKTAAIEDIKDKIKDHVHKPHVVHTNQEPEFQQVLVIQAPPKPSLLDHLWKPSGFGLFSKPKPTKKPVDLAKEENVFSSAIEGAEDPVPGPTEAPGLFGSLFGNPSQPLGVQQSGHAVLDPDASFPRPTNKPLIIERPGARPLLVEKPIYIKEKPAESLGLLNFLIPPSNKPLLNVPHEVIKDPVYVYQKPQSASGILNSVFQGWAIFGNNEKKPDDGSDNQIGSSEVDEDFVFESKKLSTTTEASVKAVEEVKVEGPVESEESTSEEPVKVEETVIREKEAETTTEQAKTERSIKSQEQTERKEVVVEKVTTTEEPRKSEETAKTEEAKSEQLVATEEPKKLEESVEVEEAKSEQLVKSEELAKFAEPVEFTTEKLEKAEEAVTENVTENLAKAEEPVTENLAKAEEPVTENLAKAEEPITEKPEESLPKNLVKTEEPAATESPAITEVPANPEESAPEELAKTVELIKPEEPATTEEPAEPKELVKSEDPATEKLSNTEQPYNSSETENIQQAKTAIEEPETPEKPTESKDSEKPSTEQPKPEEPAQVQKSNPTEEPLKLDEPSTTGQPISPEPTAKTEEYLEETPVQSSDHEEAKKSSTEEIPLLKSTASDVSPEKAINEASIESTGSPIEAEETKSKEDAAEQSESTSPSEA